MNKMYCTLVLGFAYTMVPNQPSFIHSDLRLSMQQKANTEKK